MARGRLKKPQSDPDANTGAHGATTGYETELWRMADTLRGSMDAAKAYGPLRRTYSFRWPGLVRGSEHSAIRRAMKPRSGSASLALTSWFT